MTAFRTTGLSSMEENRLAQFEGGSDSPLLVKIDWNCLIHILAFSFVSVLRITFPLNDVISNVSFLSVLMNDQNFLIFSG